MYKHTASMRLIYQSIKKVCPSLIQDLQTIETIDYFNRGISKIIQIHIKSILNVLTIFLSIRFVWIFLGSSSQCQVFLALQNQEPVIFARIFLTNLALQVDSRLILIHFCLVSREKMLLDPGLTRWINLSLKTDVIPLIRF